MWINTTCSDSYHPEIGATQSLFKKYKNSENLDSQAIFLRQKRRSETKKNWSECNKIGMSTSSTATSFLEVGARFSLKVVNKALLKVKKP